MISRVDVSKEQREEMEHAIGINYHKKPYRNKFYTQSIDEKWNDLVNKGLAKKSSGWEVGYSYFYLTIEGFAFLGINITEEDWRDL